MARPQTATPPVAPRVDEETPTTIGDLLFLAIPRPLFQKIQAAASARGQTVALWLADAISSHMKNHATP